MLQKILITGGDGKLANAIYTSAIDSYSVLKLNKKELNIVDYNNVKEILDYYNPDFVIHSAAITKPMSVHDSDINNSINVNIIGTANIVKVCNELNIKLIYISTDYVYPENTNNANEEHPLRPINNYAWSKLGGESSVQMYKNSLIIRLSFIENPFPFEFAYTNVYRNLLYINDSADIILKLINEFGVINVGGDTKSIYELAIETNQNVKPKICEDDKYIKEITLNVDKLKQIL